ncbi:spore cortex-lytic enzyme [Clostridium sp. 'deep sea']|uniref:spore cortex-lytic enzyme n=1 Tax=Clostridium sp. 'deep sea' TaxID=2779445 RepID=UPI00189642A5|nr:spore cortex-lytic enzyme [Clostridium sp. 'deep sea']QOR35814.1 spore cortex-lytic enzyme [Clostridium sp. 'deep sea']
MNKKSIIVILIIIMSSVFLADAALGEKNLYWGSKGSDVTELQRKLKNWGYYKGTVDGVYGADTFNAVKFFQRRNGLTEDGIVGPAVFEKLGVSVVSSNQNLANAGSQVTNNDVGLLAKAIYGEARGEPYIGQVAIAAVILNRVESSAFPNTVSGVIFEPLAFTAVSDGQFYMTPDQQSFKAARDALNGWDPTSGCLYYFNPVTATSSWIWTRPHVMTIGKHRFLK